MKKKFAAAGCAIVIGTLAISTSINAFAADITKDRAEEIALEHAKVSQDDLSYIRTKTDYDWGQKIYEVEFYTSDYKEYDYEIAVSDGSILSFDYDAEHWNVSKPAQGQAVDLEGAKAKALENAGLKAEDVTFIKTRTDYDDGRVLYEIEFVTEDQKEYDYEIDQATGAVLKCDFDAEEYSRARYRKGRSTQNASSSSTQNITQEEAQEIALEKAGLSASQVSFIRVHQDRDDGRTVYEGEMVYGDLEYEFGICASSGAILDWDVDSIYD